MILLWSINLALLGPPDSLNVKMLEHLNRPHDEYLRLRFTEHFQNDTSAEWQAERAISFYNVADYKSAAQILETLDSTERAINPVENYRVASNLALANIEVLQNNKDYSHYSVLFTNKTVDLSTYSDKVQLRYQKYASVKRKSVLLAGLLSTIPGLGKVYCGYHRQARSSAIVQVFFGIIATESLYRYGLQSALGQSALSISGMWWLSGIYGTMQSLKKERRDRKAALIKAIWEEENRKLMKLKRIDHKVLSETKSWQKDSLLLSRLGVMLSSTDSMKAEAEWRYFKYCVQDGLNAQAIESIKRLNYSTLSAKSKRELHTTLPIFWYNQENYTEALKWRNDALADTSDRLKSVYNEIHLRRKEYHLISSEFKSCISALEETALSETKRTNILPLQHVFLKKQGKAITTGLIYLSPPMMLGIGIAGQMPISGALLGLYTAYRIYGSSAEASNLAVEEYEKLKQQEILNKKLDCLNP